ncbi:MAG: 2-vinyl bacteriochlorophyllide hydratase [Pseudomonadota bacterium]
MRERGASGRRQPLYSAAERVRRDATVWTLVQGVLAPVQFLVFLVSLTLVIRFLVTGEGYDLANLSIILKTGVLYLIMVTGAIWEQRVFGQYLFAPAFYWEDMVSMAVIALHTAYLVCVFGNYGSTALQLGIALAAYAIYVINAGQFLWKFRLARLSETSGDRALAGTAGVSA